MITVYYENHTKPINMLSGENAESHYVMASCAYSKYSALNR
jgi:hypothetical protein